MSALKENSAATVDELKDFLQGMRGKSAQEVLGVIAQSGLVRGVVQATVASVVLIAMFTAGPYFLYGRNGAKPAAPAATDTAKKSDEKASNSPAPATNSANAEAAKADPATNTAADSAATPAGAPADLERAAKVLGVSDTKEADPKSNPREKDLDSLLDKIK